MKVNSKNKNNSKSDLSVQTSQSHKKGMSSLAWKSTWQLSVLSLPAVVWFIIFAYIPMFGIIIAFKDFNYAKGLLGSDWNGLANFEYLFKSNDAVRILRNTILYNIAFFIINTVVSLSVAMMLNNLTKAWQIKAYQTCLFVPYFISWVVVAYVAQALFSHQYGFLNRIRSIFGLEIYEWYSTTKPWPAALCIANTWKCIGFQSLVYYGSIISIDDSLYEAADIDGASRRQSIINITLPLLKPTIIIMFILAVGASLRADFGLFYYLPNNQGNLYPVTDVTDTYIYRIMKIMGDFGTSSAASVFQSVVGLFMVVLSNWVVRIVDEENAMF